MKITSKTMLHIFFSLLIVTLLLPMIGRAQASETRKMVVCQDKQLWLVNDSRAALIGKCNDKSWIAPVKVETAQSPNKKQGKIEKQVVATLEKTSKEQFKPVSLSETNLKQALQNQSNQSVIILNSNKLQPFIKDFLEPSMEFIIVRGVGNINLLVEKVRFTIKVAGANPTVKEMIEEIRKVYTDREDVKEYGEFYYLEDYKTWITLKEEKTAADYNLKSGDKLILTFDYARYKNLQPGVRGKND